MTAVESDPVLIVREVAEDLRCSIRYVSMLCTDGRLRAFRVGSQWRVTRSALEAFKAGQTRAAS